MIRKLNDISRDEAAAVALRGLAWLAGEPERLGRFLALTGLGPDSLLGRADDPETLAAVLDHLLGHEPDLLAFCAESGLDPTLPGRARAVLQRP